ncbi:zinc finger protein 518A [Boleophthalmus pectinirostris]|uniref:zinc finger protein 518A n=1 Tax=Boleophthalmus pectinirostris TaxID=150288 RepID=UPI00242C66BA|nr:zinc finger protein 518A [Boleophthalmus pectinirostris]
MEDHIITQDSVKSCGIVSKEDEREKMKDFVYKHFREVTDHPVLMEDGSARNERIVRSKSHCRVQQGAFFSGKILSFGCSVCKDCFTYSPNDLLKHFRLAHRGALPTYPCDLCGFVTNEFSVLQRHRIEHRNTLVTCELCQDGVQYSLLLLTRHYTMCHSLNGHFTCDWCQFSTVDAGTFVQHIHHHKETSWKCSKCSHVSLSEAEHQKHLKGHSGTFPFTCDICGYGAAKKEYLKNHIAAIHKSEKRSVWTAIEDNGDLNSPASLKLLLKKTSPPSEDSKEDHQMPKVNVISGSKLHTNDKLLSTSDEANQLSQDTLAKKDNRNGKNCNKLETSAAADVLQEAEQSQSSDSSQNSPNGMTVVRVKNKLSLPPNCTTKVIGFKMVDGKKHLVLKVIQASTASDSCAQLDHGEFSNGRNSTLDSLQADDIMTVKVKVEEEETLVSNLDSSSNDTDVSNHACSSSISEEHHITKSFDQDTSPSLPPARSKRTFKDINSLTTQLLSNATNSCVSPALPSKNSHIENGECINALLSHSLATDKLVLAGDSSVGTAATERDQNLVSASSSSCRDAGNGSLPTQEVFTFHNYSKETTSSSLDFGSSSSFELSAEKDVSPQFRLALTESHEAEKGGVEADVDVNRCEERNREGSSNVEIDGCIADVELEENPESVLQDFNIIKIEEDNIPISNPPLNHPSPALNEHTETVSIQQPNKEKSESAGCSENTDTTKQNKTTLRILQLPEGKQSVLLRTAESRFAVPLHVKASPGFKLITNSTNPQINVSYMKPAGEKPANSGIVLGSNSKIIGVPSGKGAALLTASKQGISSSSNHYLITSDLKRPLLLPRTLNSTPADKTTKTCYVLQRSALPVAQTSPAPGLRLAGTQLSLNSRPLLAMPASSAESTGNLQSGRQTFLLRYVSPNKSGLPVSNEETKGTKPTGPHTQPTDNAGNKLIFKIVSPPNSLLSNASPASRSHPVLLATRPQTQCFLLSPNNHSAGIKKFIAVQNSSQNIVRKASVFHSPVKVQPCEADKPILAPRPIRPPSQRKRRRKLLFDELPATSHKVRKLSNKALPEKEPVVLWRPVAKDQERTLRLSPLSSEQHIKWPRRCQPVVVLNHPDVDIPEVANIMKVVQRHRGAVTKVSLSQKTIQALIDISATKSSTKDNSSQSDCPQPRTVQSSVRERYLLKLKLRRKSRKKYRLVRTVPDPQQSVVFTCWFCGRHFNSQEAWIGHGQRHLLEATRDWNTLV